ncbi:NAD-dependent epimerase/dehydratase family protein [Bosea caraganae]|uniref:NAD-dependent epimerase/dehydratase family protein n=1 Tax=Bosea caraganae TaxID=2763117 RepID=A0A370L565_9HYPH|nr:NAD-dependent epimerase/dehydratase family protein [Bosea caraganae]RDJ24079.1 NAD-dependent epimerase/dehydratase family protein [Bosea caraganae]RDJ30121.1 NAD-dependent epimerase/dehydratase family protein [Bosea caraganae]
MTQHDSARQDSARLAIIGCGAVVDHHILPSLRRIGWLPSVLVDRSPERIALAAGKLGGKGRTIAKASDWREVADQFDAAIVAVPHVLHGPIGLDLLASGKHLFMEKPLAVSTEQGGAMIAAAEAGGLSLRVGLLRRYLHVARWLKALLEARVLGEVKRFSIREGFVFNWATSSDALLRRDLAGGGVLMDTGAHTLDLMLWWLGDVASLTYRDDAGHGVEADCLLECRMASGATGRVELSRTRDLRDTILIEGTEGFAEVHLAKNLVLAGSPNALSFQHEGHSPAEMPMQLFPELFDGELRDFRASVAGDAAKGITGTEGLRSVGLIERCYAARETLEMPWQSARPSTGANGDVPKLPAGSTALITGATGFIGGRLAERLVEQGVRVRCLIRNFGQATRLARLPVEIVHGRLDDAEAVNRAAKGADYVFHCAYDLRARTLNLDGLERLIEAAQREKAKGFVYVSSFSVYEPFPDGVLTEETRDGDRSWIYARTKLDLEARVLKAAREEGLNASIVQPSIVYGPFSKPWTNAPAEMLLTGEVILPDLGEGLCNAVYIDDLVDGLVLAAQRPEAKGERFIMTGPEPVIWASFYEAIAEAVRANKPSYWPADAIAKNNHGFMHDLKMVLANPKRLIQIVVRWPTARQALQAGYDALPKPLYDLVTRVYFGGGGRRFGMRYLPDPQALALYRSQAHASSEKAVRLLGYRPRYDFTAGMRETAAYLDWAYGDLREQSAAPSLPQPDATTGSASANLAHAG